MQRTFTGTGLPDPRLDLSYDLAGYLTGISRYTDAAGTMLVGRRPWPIALLVRRPAIVHRDGSGTLLAEFVSTYDLAGQLASETTTGSR